MTTRTLQASVDRRPPTTAAKAEEAIDIDLQITEQHRLPSPPKVEPHRPSPTLAMRLSAMVSGAAEGAHHLGLARAVAGVAGLVVLVAGGLIVRSVLTEKPPRPAESTEIAAPVRPAPQPPPTPAEKPPEAVAAPPSATPAPTEPARPVEPPAASAVPPAAPPAAADRPEPTPPAEARTAAPRPAAARPPPEPPPPPRRAAKVVTPPPAKVTPPPAKVAPPPEKAARPAPTPAPAPAAAAPPVKTPPPAAPPAAAVAQAPAAKPPPPVATPAPPAATSAAPKPPASQALSPIAVQRAVGRQRAGFDRCVADALSAPGGEAMKGRKIGLLIAVGNGGLVEASEVEELDIEGAPLGACLRRVAGRLLFPPFEGEAVGIRIPLQLAAPGAEPGR